MDWPWWEADYVKGVTINYVQICKKPIDFLKTNRLNLLCDNSLQ